MEEDKSWHQFNRNVLVLCHDLISFHPSPLVIHRHLAALQQPVEIIAGVMDWPVNHLVLLLWASQVRVWGQVAALLLCESLGWELSCFSSADEVSPGPRCSEMESMPFPVPLDAVWLWEVVSCSLAIDSMTWDFTTKAWTRAGSLRADREMCLPLVFTLTRGLCKTDVSTSPKSHLLNLKNNLSTTSPVSHALLALGLAAIETIQWTGVFFPDTAMDYLSAAASATWMTWLRIHPYVNHIILCHSGLKSQSTE